jgi:hypothetical protein
MADMDNINRSLKGDRKLPTLAGEQYENMPASTNIEDRRGETDEGPRQAALARTVASIKTGMRGRYRSTD